jgi:hypothetical protein
MKTLIHKNKTLILIEYKNIKGYDNVSSPCTFCYLYNYCRGYPKVDCNSGVYQLMGVPYLLEALKNV